METEIDPRLGSHSKHGSAEKSNAPVVDKLEATARDIAFAKPLPKPRYHGEKEKWSFAPKLFKSRSAKGTQLREPVPGESLAFRPWISICLLRVTYQTGSKATATGFLIGPQMVATSAHVLLNPDPAFDAAGEIEVIPGFLQTQGPANQLSRDFAWNQDWGTTPDSFAAKFDYGVIRLPKPHVFDRFGSMRWCDPNTTDLTQPFFLSGYPGANPGQRPVQQRHQGKVIDQPGPRSMFHDIATADGQSGSPLFLISGSQVQVVGIHSKLSSDMPGFSVARRVTEELIEDYRVWGEKFGAGPLTS